MERLSYKSDCGVRECTHIETFKEELGWAIDKWFRLIIITMLFKTVLSVII